MDVMLLLALVAAVAGPALAYIAAARRLSGRIGTSEASDLWKESSAMRKEYREQIGELSNVIEKLRSRIAALEAENHELRLRLGEVV